MIVRAASLDDALAIARLEEMETAAVASTLAAPATLAFVVDDGGVLAHVIGIAAADQGEIAWLCVHPAHRRRGLAGALLDALDAEWAARGVTDAWLEVRRDNAGAIALYASRGWREHGVRARYYRDGADALVFTTTLAGSRRSS